MDDRGIYNLIVKLDRPKKILVGKLGLLSFLPGYYIYTGRAKKNLQARLKRHKSRTKELHWHIDYLLQFGRVICIKVYPFHEDGECLVNQKIVKRRGAAQPFRKFGSSDCGCHSHLAYFEEEPVV